MYIREIKAEYPQTLSLDECLRLHTNFCLYNDFDQILQSDKVEIICCNCGSKYRVRYDELMTSMFCSDCKDIEVTKEHVERWKQQVIEIQNRLLHVH